MRRLFLYLDLDLTESPNPPGVPYSFPLTDIQALLQEYAGRTVNRIANPVVCEWLGITPELEVTFMAPSSGDIVICVHPELGPYRWDQP